MISSYTRSRSATAPCSRPAASISCRCRRAWHRGAASFRRTALRHPRSSFRDRVGPRPSSRASTKCGANPGRRHISRIARVSAQSGDAASIAENVGSGPLPSAAEMSAAIAATDDESSPPLSMLPMLFRPDDVLAHGTLERLAHRFGPLAVRPRKRRRGCLPRHVVASLRESTRVHAAPMARRQSLDAREERRRVIRFPRAATRGSRRSDLRSAPRARAATRPPPSRSTRTRRPTPARDGSRTAARRSRRVRSTRARTADPRRRTRSLRRDARHMLRPSGDSSGE